MFTWICPKCGREVPPAYTECPDCKAREEQAAAAPPVESAPAPPPAASYTVATAPPPPPAAPPPPPPPPPQQAQAAYAPPPGYYSPPGPPPQAAYPPSQAAYPPPNYYPPQQQPYYAPAPEARRAVPTWLLSVIMALACVGLIAGIYWIVGYFHGRSTTPSASVESPAAKPNAAVNPYQKFVEVSSIRFVEDPHDKSKTLVKFVLTNHADVDLAGLAGNVTLWGSTQRSEEDAEGSFTFSGDVKPFEAKEMTSVLNTKKKVYELPDWQNLTADVQVTAPAGS